MKGKDYAWKRKVTIDEPTKIFEAYTKSVEDSVLFLKPKNTAVSYLRQSLVLF